MAGIGFELRKLTSDDSFFNLIRANFYSSILSNGSWIISISILVAIYFYLAQDPVYAVFAIKFLVAVSYLVSSSLILSSIFQHVVNRYIADKIFEKREDLICQALLSSGLVLLVISFIVGTIGVLILLAHQSILIKLQMISAFVVLNLIWLYSNSLTGLKNYRFIVTSYLLSYLLIFLLSSLLYTFGLAGLLFAFYSGQALLLILFFIFIFKHYTSLHLFDWKIFYFMQQKKPLIYSGIFFQLGMWIDKYCFWMADSTSKPILDSMHASPIYDSPMFVAFIFMIPGLAVFFYEVEANFSRYFHRYYDAIREGASIDEINKKQIELAVRAKVSFYNVFKIQAIIALVACLFSPELFLTMGLSPMFIYLFRIDIVSVSLLVAFISQSNILYYLDKNKDVFFINFIFFGVNFVFTMLSIYLGPAFYGYGFALSLLIANLLAAFKINESFKQMTYFSFMFN